MAAVIVQGPYVAYLYKSDFILREHKGEVSQYPFHFQKHYLCVYNTNHYTFKMNPMT